MKFFECFWRGLAVFLLAANPIQLSHAEQAVVLAPIFVSSNRSPVFSGHIADQTDIWTGEDLQKLPVHNLAEAFRYISGVDIQTSGPLGQASSVSIRGSASRQVLVMVDGIPFNTQVSGQANLSQIPLENVERIEIIKGGASSAWGSSLGGVINVITKSPAGEDGHHGSFSSRLGASNMNKNSFDINGRSNDFSYTAFGSLMNADGELSSSRTKETKGFVKLTYDVNPDTSLAAVFGYSDAQLQYGPTVTNLILNQPYTSRYGSLTVTTDRVDHVLTAAYKFNDQKIRTDTYSALSGSKILSVTSRDLYHGLSLNDVYDLRDDLILTMGADFDQHLLKSDRYLRESRSVHTQAPYVNLVWSVEDWDFIPGLRYDRNSHFGSQVSPSFGAVYHVSQWEDGLIRAQVLKVFNAPPMLWLYNSDPVFLVAPNPDLEAEKAVVYEIGIEGPLGSGGLKGTLDFYYSDVEDGIATVFSGGFFQSRNFRKFVRQGAELKLDYVSGPWRAFGKAAFNDARDDSTDAVIRDAGIARQSFKWGGSYSWSSGWTASLQGYYNRWSSSPRQANDRKPVFDARLAKSFYDIFPDSDVDVDMEIFLNIYNLGNTTYWSSPTFPLPGRSVEAGCTLKF